MIIEVFGLDPDSLDNREKEKLAQQVHDALVENFDAHPDSVRVGGYGEYSSGDVDS